MIKRIYDLVIKMISVKGVFALLMTGLSFLGKVESYYVFAAWCIFIGGREVQKYLKKE